MTSGATALDLPFGGFTTTSNPLYQRRKMDLCGYNRLFLEIDLFSTEVNN